MANQVFTTEQLRDDLEEGLSVVQIAKKRGVIPRTVSKKKAKLKATGYDPENGRYHRNPENHPVSGYSTLIRYPEGDSFGRVLEWVKTNQSITEQLSASALVVAAMADDLPVIKPIKKRNVKYDDNKFTVIPVGDPHVGLMTWAKEVGEDWDISIAQRVYAAVVHRLLERAPDTKECILVNTGDLFHADNIAGETSRSGHKLDLDGRPAKWLEAGVVIVRMMIEACLHKYEKVTFINIPGNHDDILGLAMGVFTDHMYEKQDRLTVMRGTNPFQYIHRGSVLLGFAHGHTAKLRSLPGKMADDQHALWGQSTERHWFTGHVHHNQWQQYKEHPGCTVESVGIIPPKDAYAYGGAYGAKRTLQAVVFDYDDGEFERYMAKVRASD